MACVECMEHSARPCSAELQRRYIQRMPGSSATDDQCAECQAQMPVVNSWTIYDIVDQ